METLPTHASAVPSVPSAPTEYDATRRLRALQRRRNNRENPLTDAEQKERQQLLMQGFDPHTRAGLQWEAQADLFLARFPIGTQFTTEEFDAWADSEGLYEACPGADPQSKDWMAMLQWRHRWLRNIRTAGSRRRNYGPHGPFTIERLAGETMEVRLPWAAIAKGADLMKGVETLIRHKSDYLDCLIASTDMTQLTESEQDGILRLHDEITYYRETLELQTKQLHDRFDKHVGRLKDRVLRGELIPRNGALRALIPEREVPAQPTSDEPYC